VIIPNPSLPTWAVWAETLIGFNEELKNQLFVMPETKWKEFGKRLCLVFPRAPRPEFHRSWRDWARALQMAAGT
jgi:hypothetical protein